MTQKLLRPADVRERLGVSQSTLYSWANKKINLIPRKIGGLLRYKESDLENFINGSEGDSHEDIKK